MLDLSSLSRATQTFLENQQDFLSLPLAQSSLLQSAIEKDHVLTLVFECHPKDSDKAMMMAKNIENAEIQGINKIRTVVSAQKIPEKMSSSHERRTIPGVKKIIAVASGKGGVGKSSVSVMLAHTLTQRGQKIALVDADIYGPSLPMMMGLRGIKPEVTENKKLIPLMNHGIQVMSIGFMIPENSAMIWRGPMVQSAFLQLMFEVAWKGVDTLILDLPPGTGDVQLTLSQQVHLDGAVIVSTPQDIALLDAKRAIAMFERVNIPILGVIENMQGFHCPSCGHESHVFSSGAHHNGVASMIKHQNIPFLGAIPLDPRIPKAMDRGEIMTLPESIVFDCEV